MTLCNYLITAALSIAFGSVASYLAYLIWQLCHGEYQVEKKYIAFINSSLSSGTQTRENALKWAAEQLGTSKGATTAYLAEVTDVIERKTPPIEVRPFVLPTQEVAKAE